MKLFKVDHTYLVHDMSQGGQGRSMGYYYKILSIYPNRKKALAESPTGRIYPLHIHPSADRKTEHGIPTYSQEYIKADTLFSTPTPSTT